MTHKRRWQGPTARNLLRPQSGKCRRLTPNKSLQINKLPHRRKKKGLESLGLPPFSFRRKLPCPHGRVVGSPRWLAGVPGEPRGHYYITC
eukprot:139503-Prorocentrum_minimum.AAC.1